jgi:phosphate ABC transporter phosphate-binding protein
VRHITQMAVVLALGGLSAPAMAQDRLSGSGSTFIKPIMDKWIAEYTKENGGEINYQGQGSGAGVKQMTDKAVDFGCTDAFMKRDQLSNAAKSGGDVIHVPLAMGAIVVAYNLRGVDKPLNFSGEVLADIFLGTITNWNDDRLKELNPGVDLPDKQIAVVQRADASGSTSIFAEFLHKRSAAWKQMNLGSGTTVNWPTGVRENQTAGVAGAITKSEGSIGYIELFYALQNKIRFGSVKNSAGNFIVPSLESVSAAGAALVTAGKVNRHLCYSLVDAPGEKSYPLSGTTWAVLYVKQDDGQAKALKSFLTWVLHKGQGYASSMDYAPLPEGIARLAEANVESIQPR